MLIKFSSYSFDDEMIKAPHEKFLAHVIIYSKEKEEKLAWQQLTDCRWSCFNFAL